MDHAVQVKIKTTIKIKNPEGGKHTPGTARTAPSTPSIPKSLLQKLEQRPRVLVPYLIRSILPVDRALAAFDQLVCDLQKELGHSCGRVEVPIFINMQRAEHDRNLMIHISARSYSCRADGIEYTQFQWIKKSRPSQGICVVKSS